MVEQQTIKNLSVEDRPRERLINKGAGSLSTSELLAILLGKGSKKENALSLAQKLLKQDDVKSLSVKNANALLNIHGIGPAKACQLVSAFELGRRVASLPKHKRKAITSAQDIATKFLPRLQHEKQEHFVGVFLNARQQIIAEQTIFIGSASECVVHPRELFQPAIVTGSSGVILVHNHPSGDPQPSDEDVTATKELYECGTLLGIDFVDHVIIGDNQYVSLKEEGYF